MTTIAFDALAHAAGHDLGRTEWTVIDQARVNAFADVTEDHQWIHVDPVRATAGPYGSTIAHGYLTSSFAGARLPNCSTCRTARASSITAWTGRDFLRH